MPLFRPSRYRLAPALPDLTEIQYRKFTAFLSKAIAPSLDAINPIQARRKNMRVVLYPNLYLFCQPKMTERQAFLNKETYAMSLFVVGQLFRGNQPVERPQWLDLGQLPIMTRRGHFIINGRIRVLVHQIVRRPGLYFKEKIEGVGWKEERVLWGDFICQRGSWVRIQRDKKKRLWFCLKNTRKINLKHMIAAMSVVEGRLAQGGGGGWTPDDLRALSRVGERLGFAERARDVLKPSTKTELAAHNAYKFIYTRFKNPRTYTLGSSARYQINRKLQITENSLQLTANDLQGVMAYLLDLDQHRRVFDDIDNLGNRRLRSSSELFQIRLETGLAMLAKSAKRKLNRWKDVKTSRLLVDSKPFRQAFRDCFVGNPLAQFLDQVNPLSTITHKRRIYATGPGGVSKANASLVMRSIHPTYYGRLCPIETPEGKAAGLVNSLTVFGRVSEDGFLQTPYYRMFKGQIQTRAGLHYVTTAQEEGNALTIAPLDLGRDRGQVVSGTLTVPARIATDLQEDFVNIPREQVEYIGVGPPQLMSIATSLIPFLEHDDANRALMGANMQRQTVPVLRPTRPIVSTGLEALVVGESGHALLADKAGIVSYSTSDRIEIESGPALASTTRFTSKLAKVVDAMHPDYLPLAHRFPGFSPASLFDEATATATLGSTRTTKELAGERTQQWLNSMSQTWPRRATTETKPKRRHYELETYEYSNQKTALTQRPAVSEGQWVQRGDLLADCAASIRGQLAIGQNLFVAYVPWEGYNFEDAVVISERLVFDDLYTTLHIEKFDTKARDMAASLDGTELITRDLLPELSPWDKAVLDEEGIIRVGRWVEPGDTLVRKMSRLKPQPLSPYARLTYAILDEKPSGSTDMSFRVPRGVRGRVVNTQVIERMKVSPQVRSAYKEQGITAIPETLPSKVRVFIAEKRRIQVGDKVAGRHGNKGIISCILPRQDMPYLPDGQGVDMVLNPLGVPSRMNVGQIFECLLGLAGSYLQQEFRITPFDEIFGAEASRSIVFLKLYQARLKTHKKWLFQPNFPGKVRVFDGRSGECFDQFVTVGCAYMLKLVHLVEEKIHARTTGPYAMVTEQPVGGRGRGGGQRLGEMEVWALEAYGAAYTLQEMLTIKSDDFEGRARVTETILDPIWKVDEVALPEVDLLPKMSPKDPAMAQIFERADERAKDYAYKANVKRSLGTSDTFRVLVRELQSLCLDVGVYALSTPLPKKRYDPTTARDAVDYEKGPKRRYRFVEDNESELVISKEAIELCDPVIAPEDYLPYARRYKSQFGIDF
jgi:DNA-directed RNA polymerase subunit beta